MDATFHLQSLIRNDYLILIGLIHKSIMLFYKYKWNGYDRLDKIYSGHMQSTVYLGFSIFGRVIF